MGNILIKAGESSDSVNIDDSDKGLVEACRLLGCDVAKFKNGLTKRYIQTGREKFEKDLTVGQSVVARDSLAKFMLVCLCMFSNSN